jgi:transposase
MIEVAIERARLAKYRGVVWDLLDGYKRYEIAKRHGISQAKVTELLEKFESEMQTLIRACC